MNCLLSNCQILLLIWVLKELASVGASNSSDVSLQDFSKRAIYGVEPCKQVAETCPLQVGANGEDAINAEGLIQKLKCLETS